MRTWFGNRVEISEKAYTVVVLLGVMGLLAVYFKAGLPYIAQESGIAGLLGLPGLETKADANVTGESYDYSPEPEPLEMPPEPPSSELAVAEARAPGPGAQAADGQKNLPVIRGKAGPALPAARKNPAAKPAPGRIPPLSQASAKPAAAPLPSPSAGGTAGALAPASRIIEAFLEEYCVPEAGGVCGRRMALDGFRAGLQRVLKGQKLRVLVLGDSLIMGEIVTGTLRDLLTGGFGDGGPGFVFPLRPTRWYGPMGLRVAENDDWRIHRITTPSTSDGLYGLGGHSFKANGSGSRAFVRCGGNCRWSDVSKVFVYYLAAPGGGSLELKTGKGEVLQLDTSGKQKASRMAVFDVQPQRPDLELRALSGSPRIFGVAFERAGAGVVLDAVPVVGARSYRWTRNDRQQWAAQLKERPYDMVVLVYGTNESEGGNPRAAEYTKALSQVVDTLKDANPATSVLVVSAPARGERKDGNIRTRAVTGVLRDLQRRVARARGCAFFDLWAAMGGEGGAKKFFGARPRLISGDLTHLTREGGAWVGSQLFSGLTRSINAESRPAQAGREVQTGAAATGAVR